MQLFQGNFFRLPELETERLRLRPLRMSDARDMYAYARDPQVSRHVLWDAHENLGQSRQFLRASIRQYRMGMPGSFAIELKSSGRMIGTIGFMWVNAEHRSAEVGYSLGREYWNKGLMTEALRAVIGFGFDTMRLHRIEAQHDVANPASGRVMAHVGMVQEGILRHRVMNKGKYVDVAVYAILESDQRL
ncbi:MAG: GNAT family N-acetyltransferase [Clostridiales bacterium]|nr:GNAT family N-acetyltransferase [Clostridiales bacterium]